MVFLKKGLQEEQVGGFPLNAFSRHGNISKSNNALDRQQSSFEQSFEQIFPQYDDALGNEPTYHL